MSVLATLFLGHLVADFPLQTNWIFRYKLQSWLGIVLHCLIHAVVTAVFLRDWLEVWPLLLISALVHFVCDWLKTRPFRNSGALGFVIDQLAHIAILTILSPLIPSDQAWLSLWVLYPALLIALIPAGSMFLIVLNADLAQRQMKSSRM